ncbi:MAG: large conductance mechanosensitive channel protein MscL [Candidatus Howiella sp.]
MAKGKGILGEFKTFIMRGNVIDMAVGVIIGGAFQKIITSLVDDVVMPVITLITGGIDFNNWFIALDGGKYASLTEAKTAGAATLNYGTFITVVINFLLMAAVIFLLVKGMNALAERTVHKKEEAPAAPTVKVCPYCLSEVPAKATRCAHCTSALETEAAAE